MKCNTCLATFPSMEVIKDHYKSEWHCFNSKRRAQNLPILRREQFQELVKASMKTSNKQPVTMTMKQDHSSVTKVAVPSSASSSSKNLSNQVESSSSPQQSSLKEGEGEGEEGDIKSTATVINGEEVVNNSKEKEKEREYQPILGNNVCIFDDKQFPSAEDCLEYMSSKYGFFIPDFEYMVDLEGFIEYLNEKVKIGGVCLYCQKRFENGRSCQHHMLSKSHCKIAYDDNEDDETDEYEDFYDFSATYEDVDEVELDENGEVIQDEAHVATTGELILPDGKILGHRMFRRYYKQYYHPQDTREPILAQQREELLRLGYKFGNSDAKKLTVSKINEMSEIEIMTNLIKYQKEIRKGQMIEQRGKMRRENMDRRREYKSTIDKLRSSENTTAKIRDYHGML